MYTCIHTHTYTHPHTQHTHFHVVTRGEDAGRAKTSNVSNGATGAGGKKGEERNLELTAALHATQMDASVHRVAILDLDGRLMCVCVCVCGCVEYVYVHVRGAIRNLDGR